MASITKGAKGYRAQVYVSGVRDSASFRTKREAEAWASARETELRTAKEQSPGERTTLGEVMRLYVDKVSPGKRGHRWEQIRIDKFCRDEYLPVAQAVARLTPEQIGAWRDARLKQVQAGSVLREMSLLAAILDHARLEWRMIASNPARDVRKPRSPDHREVTITRWQIRALLAAMGYRPGSRVTEVRHAVATCFLVALRTGMRAGELCRLTWGEVRGDYCVLPITKTVPRHVPLTPKAMRLIGSMRGWDERLVFGLKPASLDAIFRKYRDRAGLAGFTFHDARHTAATWLAPHMDILDMCKMFGWSNPRQALTYFNPTASEIAKRITQRVRA